jgi:hypothetical protein
MAPKKSAPRPVKRKQTPANLTSIVAISFSLTFVATGVLLLLGLLPPTVASLDAPVDIGVLLLIVPLCALVLAIMAEVLRAAISGLPKAPGPRVAPLTDCRPGHGEG